jgi:hypothetical protein
MARGWESKSVESQMEAAASRRPNGAAYIADTTPVQIQYKRDSLTMSRTRVLHDLQTASNPRYRAQLESALAYLDQELAKIGIALSASA